MSVSAHRRAPRALMRLLTRGAVILSVSVVGATALAGVARADTTTGSNGTVKVDGFPFDASLGNEPHVGCSFQLDFYGFDAGTNQVTVAFTAQPPSGSGPVNPLPGQGSTSFTMQGSGPGNSLDVPDAQQTYELDTSALTLQPQQGYHIQIATQVTNAAGVVTFSKQKVIWVSPCSPPPPVAPTLAGLCDTTTGQVTWTVTNPNAIDLIGNWSVTPGTDSGVVTAPANSAGTFTSGGGTATVVFPADNLTAGPVTVTCPPPLASPTLAGVCDATNGHVTWTVTNPNPSDLTGTWTVTPSGETGSVTAPANATGTFTSTTGGTANVTFGSTGLTAGPVHVACSAPPLTPTLAAAGLAGVCNTSTGQVTWTLTNPNDSELVGTWTSGSQTGTVTVPANGTASFTTTLGSVTVTFPAATKLAALTGTEACVEAVKVEKPPTTPVTTPVTKPVAKPVTKPVAKPVTRVLGERLPRTPSTTSRPSTAVKAVSTQLPFTGSRSTGLVPYAVGMVLAGSLLVLAGRRRRA